LNDHDERIMTVYRVCQDPLQHEALRQRLHFTPYARAECQRSRQIQREGWADADPVTRAWAIIVNLQQSFANNLGGGWRTNLFSRNSAASWWTWLDGLNDMLDRLRHVYLECDDALAVMQRWDSPQTLFYCDPPYLGADMGHYATWTASDLQALIATIATCQGSVVLSGYPSALIPTDWPCHRFDAYASSSGQGQTAGRDRTRKAMADELGDRHRTECVWVLDRSAGIRADLQSALWQLRQADLLLE
jgi:DNA adenine methylase